MKEDLFFLGIKALIRNPNGSLLLLKVNPKLFNTLLNLESTAKLLEAKYPIELTSLIAKLT